MCVEEPLLVPTGSGSAEDDDGEQVNHETAKNNKREVKKKNAHEKLKGGRQAGRQLSCVPGVHLISTTMNM